MPIDGGFLHKIAQEIDTMSGARVDKIAQPGKDLLILSLRGSGVNRKLLLSAGAAAPKVHFTHEILENPKMAPMFCMLLRKHLGGGRLLRAEQPGLDRVLRLVFETANELGDRVETSLVCEVMGRHSNIILVDAGGKIIDAVKRVDFAASGLHPVLPGITYRLPPAQEGKRSLLEVSPRELARSVAAGRDIPLSKAILEQVQGLSPLVCREAAHFACGPAEVTAGSLTPGQLERLEFFFGTIATALGEGCGIPTLVRDPQGQKVDFSFLDIRQYPEDWQVDHEKSFSLLLDKFYAGKDSRERMRQMTSQIRKHLVTQRDRLVRKLAAQTQELEAAGDRDRLRQWGDIITANLYRIRWGETVLRAPNFFSPEEEMIEIPLDKRLTPIKNAQKYYTEYKKAGTAEAKLMEQIQKGNEDLRYLESAIEELDRASSEEELQGIREELASQGYLRPDQKVARVKPLKLPPLRYHSSDGFLILCGRNNIQNDQLTLREARNTDLWLHTQKIHGAHVIVVAEGQPVPDRTIEEAAVIAACHSAAGTSDAAGAKIPVDYTLVKHVKKPAGARPGMVVYHPYRTALVPPDHKLEKKLREK